LEETISIGTKEDRIGFCGWKRGVREEVLAVRGTKGGESDGRFHFISFVFSEKLLAMSY